MKAICFDTETDGLVINRTLRLEKQPEIIEFYACVADLSTGAIGAEVHRLCKPKTPIDEKGKAHKAVGLTNAMLADEQPFAAYADEVKAFMEQGLPVIAHNVSFDVEMVDIELERLGKKLAWPPCICTVEQTVHVKGYRMSMNDLHEYLFGERFEGAHRANIDVAALVRCATELYRRGML